MLDYVEMFRGTVTQTSVYPRELVKDAIRLGSVAVLLVHNHPTLRTAPSRADEVLTSTIKNVMGLIDVRVLDHLIVGGSEILSMAEAGLM